MDVFDASTGSDEGYPAMYFEGVESRKGMDSLKVIEAVLRDAMDEEALDRHSHMIAVQSAFSRPSRHSVKISCVSVKTIVNMPSRWVANRMSPKNIMIFTKAPTTRSRSGEDGASVHDELTEQLDYEGELAVIIGKKADSGFLLKKRMDHVFGYSILNDITARDLQKKHGQFFIGKSLDTTCPMGPLPCDKG